LLDTNVLIPFFSKDFLLELGFRGLPVRWSRGIEAEFRSVWARLNLGSPADATLILEVAHAAIPDWRAPERQSVARTVLLPDPDDRHVLAAAVGCGATVIVTRNLKDFPPDVLGQYGIEAMTPDKVISDLYDARPDFIIAAAAAMRSRLMRPPMTVEEWLAGLVKGQLEGVARRLERHRLEL
jgi:hypothetical protein